MRILIKLSRLEVFIDNEFGPAWSFVIPAFVGTGTKQSCLSTWSAEQG